MSLHKYAKVPVSGDEESRDEEAEIDKESGVLRTTKERKAGRELVGFAILGRGINELKQQHLRHSTCRMCLV